MAYAAKRIVIDGAVTDVDTTKKYNYGERFTDENGKEYRYLKGVASTIAGSWVTYDPSTGATTLLAANAVGPVAIAMGAIDSTSKYGWYQIYGLNITASTDTVAANKALYIDGTAGRADDAVVSGDLIAGANSVTADTSNVASVFLNFPYVNDVLG